MHAHAQFTIYALALARRTNLPLKFFRCGWFDEKECLEFFPLQRVYKKKRPQMKVGSKGMKSGHRFTKFHKQSLTPRLWGLLW